ncbi:MAG TPA: DUF3341 domain-containing protein [Myxococcales bacterium]|nr:DUF3341 domain-containing protein [Myxococcales bacterium]
MPREPGWLGLFAAPEQAARAIEALRAAGAEDVRAGMPAPYEDVQRALGRGPSKLGFVTFGGALLGACLGYLFAGWTALDWPLDIGGRPPVAWVPHTVIAFECAVLIGALTNLAAVLWSAARERGQRPLPPRPAFAGDRVGVFVPEAPVGVDCDAVLRAAGAVEVERVQP